jgi:recombination protein RecT
MTETKKTPETATPKGTELALLKKNITDQVMERIAPMVESKEIRLPANYSVGNALTSAFFDLQEIKVQGKSVLEVCTKSSIANALFKMAVWGLSSAKKQVAFIAYGETLTCQPEYHGNIALAKRYGGVAQVNAGVIYQNDVFEYAVNAETGRKKIIKHEQAVENISDDHIKGAYAVLTFADGTEPFLDVMSIDQIRKSWLQGAAKGNSPAHKNFPGEMCKKTVSSRACKLFFTTSDDSVLMDDDEIDIPITNRDEKVKEKGSKKHIDIHDTEFEEVGKGSFEPGPENAGNLLALGTEKQNSDGPGY